jgi:transcriptional regulator of met regulon
MMGAVNNSETSASFHQTTRRNIPEDSHLHTRRRENLKSHDVKIILREIGCAWGGMDSSTSG